MTSGLLVDLPGGPAPRGRRTADARRSQLIGIGLGLLATRPIYDVTVDDVAAEAGISRTLLFHYFPTKRDFYAAVVRAAARRMQRAMATSKDAEPSDRLRALLDAFVGFVDRHPEPYIALVRGAAGGDAWILPIYDETRDAVTSQVLDAVGLDAPTPVARLAVRAWLAFAEDMTIGWTRDKCLTGTALIDLLVRSLDNTLDLADGPKRPGSSRHAVAAT